MKTLLPLPRRLCSRRCLSVCLLATLRNNFLMDLHEIFGEGWQWAVNKRLNFGGNPHPYCETGKTCLGGGMHCPSASSCKCTAESDDGTHNRFTALFPGPPGWTGARRELLDFMVQGKINRGRHTDHPDRRHSIRTNYCPPPPSDDVRLLKMISIWFLASGLWLYYIWIWNYRKSIMTLFWLTEASGRLFCTTLYSQFGFEGSRTYAKIMWCWFLILRSRTRADTEGGMGPWRWPP